MLDRPQAMTRKLPLDVPGNRASAPRASTPGAAGPGPGGGRERHPLARPQAPPSRRRDEMGPALMISAVVHTVVVVVILLGLPDLFKHEPPPETSISVTLVNPAKETRTTTRNPHPKADAKPITPPPIPAEKPLPPIPDPLTPPPAPPPPPPKTEAAPPPPPVPQTKPDTPPPPPVPQPKPETPPPPKTEAASPPPPVPQIKPPPPVPQIKPPPPQTKPPPDKLDEDFGKLLGDLTKPAPQKAVQPPKTQKQQQQQAAEASSLANAPLGSQITTSEKDMIASAVEECWGGDAGAKGFSDMKAVVLIELNPDFTVRRATLQDTEGRGNDPAWRAFAERAARAPMIAKCNKLPIPPGKYDELKEFTLTFTPEGVQ